MLHTPSGYSGMMQPFYDPLDMTACVSMDMTCEELDAMIRSDGLYFPLAPASRYTLREVYTHSPWPPAAHRFGTLADNTLGLNIQLNGSAVQCGGRVLKNVTGFDLTRFIAMRPDRIGTVSHVTLRLQPAGSTYQHRIIRGSHDQLDHISASWLRSSWGMACDVLALVTSPGRSHLHVSFGCAEEEVRLFDDFFRETASHATLEKTDSPVETTLQAIPIKTRTGRATSLARQLCDELGGQAWCAPSQGVLEYMAADPLDTDLFDRLTKEIHDDGGHILLHGSDQTGPLWERELVNHLKTAWESI